MADFPPPVLAGLAAGLLLRVGLRAGLDALRVAAPVTFFAAFVFAGAAERLIAAAGRRGAVTFFLGTGRDGTRELFAAGFLDFAGVARGAAFFDAGRTPRDGWAARFATAFTLVRAAAGFDVRRTVVPRAAIVLRAAVAFAFTFTFAFACAAGFAARGAGLVGGLGLRTGAVDRDLTTARTGLVARLTVFFAAVLAFAAAAGLPAVLAAGFAAGLADLDATLLVAGDDRGAGLAAGLATAFGACRAGAVAARTGCFGA